MKKLRSAFVYLGILGVSSAWAQLPETTAFPLPPDVVEAGHVELAGGTLQDYFWIETPFPSTPALPHYEQVFAKWSTCLPLRGWHVVGESPQRQDHYLHKFQRHWISPDNQTAVTLLFQYWSPGQTVKILPRNDNQMVSLIKTPVSDARLHFEALGLKCRQTSTEDKK